MARVPPNDGATEGQKLARVTTASTSAARQCGSQDEGATTAAHTCALQLESRNPDLPLAPPGSPTCVQLPQQPHVDEPYPVIPQVTWPEQDLEEQRQELVSRVERSKAYGAYLRHQADLRRQRDLLEKLTRHNYSAGIPVSSTHEAFTSPSAATTGSVAARASVSKAPWLTKSVHRATDLCAHKSEGNNGSSLSKQLLAQQQLLYQQQQCLLQQQQQQELLRQQQEQQIILQQQQQQLLQQQQRLLKHQQPLERKESPICSSSTPEPRVVFSANQPGVRLLRCSGQYSQETPLSSQAIAGAASSVRDYSTLVPARCASLCIAASPAAAGLNKRRADTATFDAELSPPAQEESYFSQTTSAHSLHPAFPPRLRRVPRQSGSHLVTATALALQQQQIECRRSGEERRAYGQFLKRQIEQRRAAERAEKELDRRLYGMREGFCVSAGSLKRMHEGAGAALRSRSEKASHDEETQFCFQPPSQPFPGTPAHGGELVGDKCYAEEKLSETSDRTKHGPHSNRDPKGSNGQESKSLNKSAEEVTALDIPLPCSEYKRGNRLSTHARSTSLPTRKMSTGRTARVDDDKSRFTELQAEAAATCAARKKKQQEYRDFLLMQIEQKKGAGEVAGSPRAPFAEEQADKRFGSRISCLKVSAPIGDFDEVGPGEAASSTAMAAAGTAAANGSILLAPAAVETGEKSVLSGVSLHGRRGRVGNNASLAYNSKGILGNVGEQSQADEAQEEQQRLMREHDRRKAYQAALLQQIREREQDRERQRQEKMREQESERQLLYEALEEERRNMRTGRKTVNSYTFTKKDSNADEFTTIATTAGAELDIPPHRTSSLEAVRAGGTDDCTGYAYPGRKSHFEGDGRPRAFTASPVADTAPAKQRCPRNHCAATPTASLSRSASSAVMLCSPGGRKPWTQQQPETADGLEADKRVDNICAGVAALHGYEKGPQGGGSVASCLQTVHLEMPRQQEQLRNMKLQQQLSALQQRVQQDELTRLLSALAQSNQPSTTHGVTASGSSTAGGAAARTEGINVCLENQHPLLLQPCIRPQGLLVPCRTEQCENSSGGPGLTAPSCVHGKHCTRSGTFLEEETYATLAAGLASAKEAARGCRTAVEQDIRRPFYTSSHVCAAGLSTEQQHQHLLQHCQHQEVHPLLQQIAAVHHEMDELRAKVVHLRRPGPDGSVTTHENSGSPTNGDDNGEKRCTGTGLLGDSRPPSAARPDGGVPRVWPPRRLWSNRVDEIIDSFTKWIKPASTPRREVRETPPRRSASLTSSSSLSGTSVIQTSPPEAYAAPGKALPFPHMRPYRKQGEQQHLCAQQTCSACGGVRSSCDCSSRCSRFLPERHEDTRSCYAGKGQPGNGAYESDLIPSSLVHPVTNEAVSPIDQCTSCRRHGCINRFAAQRRSDQSTCNLPPSLQFAPAGPATGLPALASPGNGRQFFVTCGSAVATATAIAASHGSSSCCGAASELPQLCSCSHASNTHVASSCSPHLSNSCGSGAASRAACPLADCQLSDSINAYMRPQQRTRACCFSSCDITNAAALHCLQGSQGLQISCTCHEQGEKLQTLQSAESQYLPQEAPSEAGEPQEHGRFVEIRDVLPLEAPSFVWSADKSEPQQQQTKKKKVVPDFMRYSVGKHHHTLATGALDRSSSLAAPENKFLLCRWLGGILAPPPSKDFPEVQQDEQQQQQQGDPQQHQQEGAEGAEQQKPQRKEERRSLWRGGRNKAQQRGAVARTRSAAAGAAGVAEKDRRKASVAAGNNSSDKVGDTRRQSRSSVRVLTATGCTPSAEGKATLPDVGTAVANLVLRRQGSSSGVKGFLGLLGHVWDRRQRVEKDRLLDEDEPPALRTSERMRMRLSWDADQPWDVLVQQGATHGERLLSATAAELQRCIESEEQQKQRKQRLQQLSTLQQARGEREQPAVTFEPNSEVVQRKVDEKKALASTDLHDAAEAKQRPRGWRRQSQSATERRRVSTPQQGNKRLHQQLQEEERASRDSSGVAAAKSEKGTSPSETTLADKHPYQNGSAKYPPQPQRGPWGTPFTNAPSTPAAPPEPHRKPENRKR